ncbi:MAG: LTA synthase family protein [Lachnospiraceae bacterium]|nr:LTA synthase family protein [Lachnospiraceae bacterium]
MSKYKLISKQHAKTNKRKNIFSKPISLIKEHKDSILWGLRNIPLMLIIPVINYYLLDLYIHNPFEDTKIKIQFLNIWLFELLMLFFLFLFGSLRASLRIQTVFFMLAGLANYYVLEFRSAPIMPWDIYSVGTAASVADNFEYTIEKNTILVLLSFIAVFAATWIPNFSFKKTLGQFKYKWYVRLGGLLISALLLSSFTNMMHEDSTVGKYGLYDKLFTPTVMSKRDGVALAFLMELEYLSIDKPQDYDTDEAEALLTSYDTNEAKDAEVKPNIIVIMNEAFSDLSILGDFETNEDYMPFIRSLMNGGENTVSGYLNVSVLGGNTANTEFEFLTGNTMAFLPQGSVAYQQYVKDELYSIPTHLKSLGYETYALHPYNSTGWNRNTVYPMLGIDTSYFKKHMKSPELIRKYVSDSACYDAIKNLYKNKEEGKPMFMFNVTMQNHSSYTESFDNFTPEITLPDISSKTLSNYLSLMKISDSATQDLLHFFQNEDEETIIVFFGDHQPTNSVVSGIYKQYGKSASSLTQEEEYLRYQVPYFIWANYDIEEASGVDTSVNYLGMDVLELAGLPLYDYARFLQEQQEQFPIVTSIRATDSEGNNYDVKDVMEELNAYHSLQYYQVFDS